MHSILLVSPVRNEQAYIEQTLMAVTQQTVLPTKWVIVDDGSTDNTAEVVLSYASKFPWITLLRKPDRGTRAVGPGVVEAFYFGLANESLAEYDFVCKLDGDVFFNKNYFENLLKKFSADPRLGAASGKPFILVSGKRVIERTHDEMVAGQINFYRSACFQSIGGFVREVHWDAIAFHRARMAGWRTASFRDPELEFHHLRVMGSSHKSIVTGRLRWGKGQYFLGTHPLYLLAIGIYRSIEYPYIFGGILIIFGYIRSWLSGEKRYEFPGFRKSLHAWQFERLGLGKRIEDI